MNSFAGFWIRFFASIFDGIIVTASLAIFYIISDIFFGSEAESILTITCYIVMIAYEILFLSSKYQATPGKSALGIYVGNLDGSRISLLKSIARYILICLFAVTVILLIIDALVLIFSSEKASLHDKICRTRVFRK